MSIIYDDYYRRNPKRWASVKHDDAVYEFISSEPVPDTLLEIGCGTGHLIAYLKRKWPDVVYTGLDFSEVAIDLATEQVSNVDFILSSLEDYNPSHKFDMILMVGALEHFAEPLEALISARKLIKGDGILFLEVPNCLAYRSCGHKEEGFFRIKQGSRQVEWHLLRPSWEAVIADAGLVIRDSLKGSQLYTEFTWILTK